MKRLYLALCWVIPISIMVFGCAGDPQIVTRTVEVSVPLPVPCVVDPGPKPSWPTADEIKAAPTHAERVRLMLIKIDLLLKWTFNLEAASSGCVRPLADVAQPPDAPSRSTPSR
jgi:hypothetical protein